MKTLLLIVLCSGLAYSATNSEIKCYEELQDIFDEKVRQLDIIDDITRIDWIEDRDDDTLTENALSAENAFANNTGNTCTYVKQCKKYMNKLLKKYGSK